MEGCLHFAAQHRRVTASLEWTAPIGALARLLVRGTAGMSIIATILIGIIGAVAGGWLYAELGRHGD